MRFLLALLLCMAACRSRIPREDARRAYVDLGMSALPGMGASAALGQLFSDRKELFDFAFELTTTLQKVEDGRFFQVQAGVKQTGSPGHDSHLVLRYGLTWFRATGNPEFISLPGDYLGGYFGAGYEWDLSPHITIGPEARVVVASREGTLDVEAFPQLGIHFTFNF
jgi:hypothetical protein